SFDLSATAQSIQAERALLTTLQALQDDDYQSFGLGFDGGKERSRHWQQASEQFQASTHRVLTVVANYAWVETQIQGKTVARTSVGWMGDFNSIWVDGVSVEQQQLHMRSLTLTLKSRNTLIENFTMAVQLALKVSFAMSLPGGAVVALPAVWQFINQVVSEKGRR
ncbi:MAG: hypothetical protein AAFY17_17255, partial [Cyanobacteria bacterium J06642_11]